MRLQMVHVNVETFKPQIGQRVHFLNGWNGLLPRHHEHGHAKFGQFFQERPFLGKAPKRRPAGAMVGIEMGLDSPRSAIERGLGEAHIVPRQRDDNRELAGGNRLMQRGFSVVHGQLIRRPVLASKR